MTGLDVVITLVIAEVGAGYSDRLIPPRAVLWLNSKIKNVGKRRRRHDR